MKMCELGRLLDLFGGAVSSPKRDVVANALIEQGGVLRNDGDRLTQLGQRKLRDWHAVEDHSAAIRLEESHE